MILIPVRVGDRVFAFGETVTVTRSDGTVENDWKFGGVNPGGNVKGVFRGRYSC